jgi:hypothetical protein
MRTRFTAFIATAAVISLATAFTTAASIPRPHHASYMPAGAGVLSTASASAKALEAAGMKNFGTVWATPVKAPKSLNRKINGGVIENIAENVIGGELVIIFQYVVRHPEIFKEFKEWVFRKIGGNYTIYRNTGDGQCLGSWGLDTHDHLGSCKSRHGIYWETFNTGAWWDTYTNGVLISQSTDNGSPIFTNKTKIDWHTWGFYSVKSTACGSHDFCGDRMVLSNHSSTGVSDTDS